jgi:hypothetical protein
MKITITEKQLARIVKHNQEIDEADATTSTTTTVPLAEPTSGPKSLTSVPSAPGTSSATSTNDIGTSPDAVDYPPYPEVGHWESGIVRGPANQIDTKSNWSDVVGSKISRGHANPLKEDIYINDSVKKIKFMMNYDSSKTLTEQSSWQVPGMRFNKDLQLMKQLFDYAETNKEQFSQIKRELTDDQISKMTATIHNTLSYGIRIARKPLATVFEQLPTISDFIAMNDIYNNFYGYKKNLATRLLTARMGTGVLNKINIALNRLETNAYNQIANPPDVINNVKTPEQSQPKQNAEGYKFTKGTSDDPYKYGTLGSGIAQIQQTMGLVQDGKWGPKTQAKMAELAPQYVNGFTNDDLFKVVQAVRTKTNPETATTATAAIQPPNRLPSVAPNRPAPALAKKSGSVPAPPMQLLAKK